MKSYNNTIKGNAKVELVMVSGDKDESKALNWAKKEKFPWPTVLMKDSATLSVRKHFKGAVPNYILTDGKGTPLVNTHSKEEAFLKLKSL